MYCIHCKCCEYGEIVKYTKQEIEEKKYPFPNIGKCDICETEFVMHNGHGRILALTIYGTIKPIIETSKSLKLYQRISFSLLEHKVIVATRLEEKNIQKIVDIIRPINCSNGFLKTIVADIKKDTISIVPKKL